MATDREREQAFRRARTAAAKELPRIQRDTDREVRRLLNAARSTIRHRLLTSPTEYQAWMLPQLERAVDAAMQRWADEAAEAAVAGQARAWQAGIDTIDRPLDAALSLGVPQIQMGAIMPAIDTQQLAAMREFLAAKMRGISTAAADHINTDLGLALLGAQDVETAARHIARVAGSDDLFKSPLTRARTVVRTELGRAYSVAGQQRLTQAQEQLPGLRKQWRRSGALHARIAHDHADGQVRPPDEPFNVDGEQLMFPRDPAGSPENTINCGCQSLPWMTSWEMRQPVRQPFTDEERARNPLRGSIERIHATVPPEHIDDWVAVSHEEWVRLVEMAGGDVDRPDFPERCRAALRRELQVRRGAGTVAVHVEAFDAGIDMAAVPRIEAAAATLPASWAQAGNAAGQVWAIDNKGQGWDRGAYFPAPIGLRDEQVTSERSIQKPVGRAAIHLNDDPGNALHEYTHHMQAAMPGLDYYYQALHRRRTVDRGEERQRLVPYGRQGRPDQYVDSYFGVEYEWVEDMEKELRARVAPNGPALEVITRAMQTLFHPLRDPTGRELELMPKLIERDPEMLHLTLGLLFRYDPP